MRKAGTVPRSDESGELGAGRLTEITAQDYAILFTDLDVTQAADAADADTIALPSEWQPVLAGVDRDRGRIGDPDMREEAPGIELTVGRNSCSPYIIRSCAIIARLIEAIGSEVVDRYASELVSCSAKIAIKETVQKRCE